MHCGEPAMTITDEMVERAATCRRRSIAFAVFAGFSAFDALAPWATESIWHKWQDAFVFGAVVVCGLMSLRYAVLEAALSGAKDE